MRKKPPKKKSGDPLWLVSYADVVTLMLCFMVLLVSLSVIDERLKMEVLGSVSRTYASSLAFKMEDDPESLDLARLQQGLGSPPATGSDLAPMKEMVITENADDMNFMENRFVQIISLNEAALFGPGKTQLNAQGEQILDRLMPHLLRVEFPLLVAGHTAPRMDEEQDFHLLEENRKEGDPTWLLSFHRGNAVYRYLIAKGMPAAQLTNENFGQYRPRFPNSNPDGRKKNRRVDLVLDRRNVEAIKDIKGTRLEPPAEKTTHEYKGFTFSLDMPEREPSSVRERANTGPGFDILHDRGEPSPIIAHDLEGSTLSPESPSAREVNEAPDYWRGNDKK